MVVANGYARPEPLLRAVGDVIRDSGRADSTALVKALGDVLRIELEKVKATPSVVEEHTHNHVDTSAIGLGLWELAKELRQAVSFQRTPEVRTGDVNVAPAVVNFDLTQLTKAIAGVVERALDHPVPFVSIPTEGLERVIKDALSFQQPPTPVSINTDLSRLATALQSLATSVDRQSELMEDLVKIAAATAKRLDRLEQRVAAPLQTTVRPKTATIHHDDGTESKVVIE